MAFYLSVLFKNFCIWYGNLEHKIIQCNVNLNTMATH